MIRCLLTVLLVIFSCTSAVAGWVKIGENNRSICYANSNPPEKKDSSKTAWVLYSYKEIQESPRSGRRYLSEKSQIEIDCNEKKSRTLFFTWHSEPMGDGVVVYTGRKITEWEPTSSPNSYGNAFWKFYCANNNTTWSSPDKLQPSNTVESIATAIAQQHNAADLSDDMTLSSTAEARGKQIIITNILRVQKDLSKQEIDKFKSELYREIVPKTCRVNSKNVAFIELGLQYTFIYFSKYNQKIAEIMIDNNVCSKLR